MASSGVLAIPASWPLVGRDAELDLAAQALREGRSRGLVIAGLPGVGKTRLAREVLRRAESREWASRWVVANSGASALPLGAFTPLLPDLSGVSPYELLGRVAMHLVSRAGGRRLLVGVDDAHNLDETSAALVHQLAAADNTFVVLTVRRGAAVPDPIIAVWKDGLAERIELSPLARAETFRLLAAALDGPVDGTTLHELFDYSRGNVLFLRELLVGGLATGKLAHSGGVWRWDGPIAMAPRLAELIEARMGRLNPAQRAALEVVAFGEPLAADVAEAMGEDMVQALEALERDGLITSEPAGGGVLIRLAHPLYGEVLQANTPSLRARAVHRQLAHSLAARRDLDANDTLRIATWQLAGGEQGDPHQLTIAADHALQSIDHHQHRHQHRRAEDLARAAITAGAGPPARRILAIAQARRGEAHQAEAVFAEVTSEVREDAERVSTAIARAVNLRWRLGRSDDAAAVLDHALAAVSNPSMRAELSAAKAGFLVYDLDCAAALRIVAPLLDDPDVGPIARVRALAVASEVRAFTGRCDTAAALAREGLDLAARLPQVDPLLRLLLNKVQIRSTLSAGRLGDARALAESGYRAAIGRHSSFETAAFAGWLGAVARFEGNLDTARTLSREAVGRARAPDVRDFRRFLPRLLAELARISAMCGDATAAQSSLDEAHELDDPPTRILQLLAGMAEPWIAAAGGASSHAAAVSLRQADRAGALGLTTFELSALHDAIRLDPTTQIASRIGPLAAECEGPLPTAIAAHAHALATGDGAGLDQAAAQFSAIGAALLAAEAATHAALAHRRRGATGTALASVNRARTWAARCEGIRSPALRLLEAPPELTPREREIAQLAARGHTSKAIAAQLVISVRTVDNALHEVYSKLGIKRRADLGPLLGQPTVHPSNTKTLAP
jgi:DNA-binding CsgD family transcriptional regulator